MPYHVQKPSAVALVDPSKTVAYYIGNNRWSFLYSDREVFSSEEEAQNGGMILDSETSDFEIPKEVNNLSTTNKNQNLSGGLLNIDSNTSDEILQRELLNSSTSSVNTKQDGGDNVNKKLD